MPQPIFIDAHGWTMPGAVAAGFKCPHRETGDEALATVIQRPRAKGLGGCGRGVVEIVLRRRRVVLTFAAEEAANVAAVFAQERVALVFRMALKNTNRERLSARVNASTPADADRVRRR